MRNAIFLAFWFGFHWLFWQEGLGVNLVIFAFLLQLYAKWEQSWQFSFPQEGLYLFAWIASAFGSIYYHSDMAQFAFIISNLVYASFHYRAKLSPYEHFINALVRPLSVRQPVMARPIFGRGIASPKRLFSYLSLGLIPLLLFVLFTALFRAGNPVFKEWTQRFLDRLAEWLPNYDLSWLAFMFLGLLVLRTVFIQQKKFWGLLPEGNFLRRKKLRIPAQFKLLALKREYRMAYLVFISLNLLLLVVNSIDIRLFWFGFTMPAGFSLKEFLYDGVGALMVSLVLATFVALYFLRGNLNFYPRNKGLLLLAKVWVIQNSILSISVFLRSWYYMDFHGLAEGRILVVVMLSVVIVALILLFLKIRDSRNAAFLVRGTSIYLGFLLGFCSLINWDAWILQHNLEHGRLNEIDVDHYLYLHPRVYPQLIESLPRIEEQIEGHMHNSEVWISVEDIGEFKARLRGRIEKFIAAEAEQSWPSWNYAEARVLKDLKTDPSYVQALQE